MKSKEETKTAVKEAYLAGIMLEAIGKEIFKNKKWKSISGTFYVRDGDFVYICFINNTVSEDFIRNPYKVTINLSFKHAQFDEVFWDIMDLQDNKKEPFNLRINGWFTLPSTPISEWIQDINTKEPKNSYLTIYDKVISLIEETKNKVDDLSAYLNYIRNNTEHKKTPTQFSHTDVLITGYIFQNKLDKAMKLILESLKVQNIHSDSNFFLGQKPFSLRAKDFCLRKMQKSD
jgi:hypothetical protein